MKDLLPEGLFFLEIGPRALVSPRRVASRRVASSARSLGLLAKDLFSIYLLWTTVWYLL